MAGNLKGIIVEIGGDTTKLGKALSDVNSKTKSLQTELKGVNTLLKMDPSNVTLLKQKQDLLTQAIAGTKEKLETLKTAQAQAQAQFEKGEITEAQYRDLQREIVLTEQKLEGLTNEFKNFGSVGAQQVAQVGEKVQEVGGKVENFGKGFSVISAGTGAILGGSIVAFKELDEGYDTIVTKTGATGEALEGLNAVADNIFGSMPTDMTSVGTAVGEINTRFGYTGDELEKLSTQFIQFAEINGVDLNNSIGTVDKVLEQFNLDGKDASGVLDLITQKAQQTGIGADTLMNSIQQNGATFKDMGIGVNEAVVLMSQFEANGVNVETALKGLKKATSEYAEEGLSMEEGLSKTISSIKNAKTESEALAIAQEVFGTKGANEMSKAIREGRLSVDDLSTALGDYGGTVSSTFEGTLDPIDQGTVAMNNLKLVGSELAGVLQATFAPMLTSLVEKLKNLATWFSNLSPGIQKIIVIVLSVVTALGPLIIIIGKLITSVGTIMTFAPKLVTAFNGIKTAFSALGTAFTANPIGIIIVAVTALVGAFIYLWNNCEGFRNFFINLWESIKSACSVAIDAIVNFFTVTIPNAWNSFITFCGTFITNIVTFFSELPGKIWTFLVNVVTSISTWATNLYNTVATAIPQIISNIVNFFASLPQKIGYAIGFVIGKLILWASNIITWITTNIPIIINNIVNFFKELPGKIWTFLVNVVTNIATWGSNMKAKATSAVTSLITSVVTFFKELPGKIWNAITGAVIFIARWGVTMQLKAKSAITTLVSNVVSTAKELPGKIWSAIVGAVDRMATWGSQMLSKAKTAVKNISSSIVDGLKSIPSKITSIGKNIVEGLWKGIKNAKDWIIGKIKDFAGGLLDGMKSALGINSPSKVFANIVGKAIPEGIAKGIVDNSKITSNAVNDLTDDITGQALEFDGATVNHKVSNMLNGGAVANTSDNGSLLNKLNDIYERLDRMQIVLDTGTLVGETIEKIDSALANKQLLNARGV